MDVPARALRPVAGAFWLAVVLAAAAAIGLLGWQALDEPPALDRAPLASPAAQATALPGGLPNYNPSDLNGGERGFARASLTVNQHL